MLTWILHTLSCFHTLLEEIHAEKNAIFFKTTDLAEATCYVTNFPCISCSSALIASGISKVYYLEANLHESNDGKKTDTKLTFEEDFFKAKEMLESCNIKTKQWRIGDVEIQKLYEKLRLRHVPDIAIKCDAQSIFWTRTVKVWGLKLTWI